MRFFPKIKKILHTNLLSTSSTAISRELSHLRGEIRHIVSKASRNNAQIQREKELAETSYLAQKAKQRITEEKFKELATLTERIKFMCDKKLEKANSESQKLRQDLIKVKL